MNLVLCKERRFVRGLDGHVYTDNEQASGYSTLRRYLDVFDSLTVVGRLREAPATGLTPVTGPGVFFVPVPHYLGPVEYLQVFLKIRASIRGLKETAVGNSAFLTRSPGALGSLLIRELTRCGHPFGMEVVGDPYDVFAPGSIKHPLRPFFRQFFTRKLKDECRRAAAVAYVTEHSLQQRYPAAAGTDTSHYSNIHLEDAHFAEHPRTFADKKTWNLIFVGTLAQLYKAPDVLIAAVGQCLREGLDLRLTIVGDGRFRPDLERQASPFAGKITFLGWLPAGEAVRRELDLADLFVLPSKGEGLPRAMIEAMARGLPCLGTTASGIPELLAAEDLAPPGDIAGLARKIREVLAEPSRMNRMAARNLQKAGSYRLELLRERRNRFYRQLHDLTRRFWDDARGESR